MRRSSGARRTALTIALVGLALLTAGCRHAATPTNPPGPATLATHSTEYGESLVDAQGRTLYLFAKDEEGESYCTGACAAIWPPLTSAAEPKAGDGVDASLLGVIDRADGEQQVTYAGHPLYYYVADNSEPGAVEGEGADEFGARWFLVAPKGGKQV